MKRIKGKTSRLKNFFSEEIWEMELEELSKAKARFIKYVKVAIITAKTYAQQKIGPQAVALSYLSVMAFFYILPAMTNGMQGFFRGMGEMKTTLAATFIQISIRTLVVYGIVPRVGITGAAYACAIGWVCMLVFTTIRYRAVISAYKKDLPD